MELLPEPPKDEVRARVPWFRRLSSPILFLITGLALVGGYVAFTIPVSVFPNTDFPRVVIGVDNGVMPIDQMLVTITRPIEEAVNSVPGLARVRSTTSRGSAEVDLFFNWDLDMFQTLQRVDSVVARVQPELPPTAKLETHRLTFATFPIIGYSLTSDTVPQNKLWEIATYDIKPRINRLDGVASIVVQGGRVPEFQVTPEPARLLSAGVTVADILEAIRRTNLIDSPGLIESNHQLVMGLVSGQVQTPQELGQIVVKNSAAGVPIRLGDIATVAPSVAPVYTIVTANGKSCCAAEREPAAGEQHAGGGGRSARANRRAACDAAAGCAPRSVLRPVDDCARLDCQRAGRGAAGAGAVVDYFGFVFAGLGHLAGGCAGDSRDFGDYLHRSESFGSDVQFDDAGWIGCRRRVGDRRRHRRSGKYCFASRCRRRAFAGHSKCVERNYNSADRIDDYADRGFFAAGFYHGSDWNFFPRFGGDHDRFFVHVAAAGAFLDADAQPILRAT